MATKIETAYVELDLDTKLFDKKFKKIKNEIAKLQKINIDVKSNMQKAGSGLATGALAGAVAGGVVGAVAGAGNVGQIKPQNITNQSKETEKLSSQWVNVAKEYGKFFKDLSNLPSKIKEATNALNNFVKSTYGVTLDDIKNVVVDLKNLPKEFDAVTRAALYFRNALIELRFMAKELGITEAITNAMAKSMSVMNQFAGNVKVISKDIVQWFKDDFESLPEKIKAPIKNIAASISRVFSNIKSELSSPFSRSLLGAIKNATGGLIILMSKLGKMSAKAFILGFKTISALSGTLIKTGYNVGKLIALGIRGGLKGIGSIIGGVKNTILRSFRFIRGAFISIIGALAIPVAGLMKEIADQKSTANLETSFAKTSKIIGVTTEQAKALVDELDKTTNFDFTELSNGAANLSTFTNITGDRFKTILELATDLSAAFGQDLKSSVVQLGKAMNDPVKGITALARVGVSFTQDQKDEIKRLVEEENNVIAAQEMIIKLMGQQGIGGQAKAMADPINQVKKGIEDWWKTIGLVVGRFVNIGLWIDKVRGKIDELNKKMLDFSMSQVFADARASAIYFFDVMSAGVMLIVDNFSQLTTRFTWLQTVLRELGYVADWVGKGIGNMFEGASDTDSWNKFQKRLSDAKKDYDENVKKPLEANDIKIGGTQVFQDLEDDAEDAGEAIKKAINITSGANAIFTNAISAISEMLGRDKKGSNKVGKGFEAAIGGNNVGSSITNNKTSVAGMIIDAITKQTEILHQDLTYIGRTLQDMSPVT